MECSKIERSIIKEQMRRAMGPVDAHPVKGTAKLCDIEGNLRRWFMDILECLAPIAKLEDERARTLLRLRYQEGHSLRHIERITHIPRRTQGRLMDKGLDAVVDAMEPRVGREIIRIYDRYKAVGEER